MTARRIGAYELGPLLGRGAMGAVHRARHVELGVERALKLLPVDATLDQQRRFEREATSLARVDHPAVVRVHEAGLEPQPHLVMDLVVGEPLSELLRRGRMPLPRALALAAGVARGAAALHAVGVVHRDLKPDNVLVREDGAPVIVDLGLALAPHRDDRLTATGALMGTPLYMAPEQLRGAPAGPEVDVWAAALIAHELVTGRSSVPPVDGLAALLDEVVHRDRPPPSAADPSLPRELDVLLRFALSRDPARRPTAAALADGLEAVARAGERGPSPTPAPGRLAALTSLAATVALAALALAAWALGPAPAPALRPGVPAPAAGPGREGPPSSDPARVTEAPPREGNPVAVRQLRRLEREEDPLAQAEAAKAWLARWRDEPDRPAAEAALRRARARVATPVDGGAGAQFVRFLDARRIVASTTNGLELHDATTGRLLRRLNEGAVGAIAVAPGPLVLAASGARLLVFADDGGQREPIVLPGEPLVVDLSRDGRRVVTGHEDGAVRVVDLAAPDRVLDVGRLPRPVRAVALSRDGTLAAATSARDDDGADPGSEVRAWRLEGSASLALSERLDARGQALAFAGRELLVGTSDGRLRALQADGGAPRELGRPGPAHAGGIRGIVVTADGRRAWSVSGGATAAENELRAWDVAAGVERYAVRGHPRGMDSVDLSPDGARLVTAMFPSIDLWLTDEPPP